jgi:sugar phosphate isomerase/epimerase
MVQTAINLYSVRDLDEPTLTILDRVADAGYDGVQFAGGLGDATPDAVASKLAENGLTPIAPHLGIDALEGNLAAELETHRDGLGCGDVVVPSVDTEHFADGDSVDALAEELTDLATTLAAEDVGLHYHNHDFEFTSLSGGTAFDRFLSATAGSDDAPPVGIELDVGWALAGGDDPAALIERLDDRIEYVHMKDVSVGADPPTVEIGTGDVDMAACADAARSVDAGWLIYEHDTPSDPAASIDHGADFLADL